MQSRAAGVVAHGGVRSAVQQKVDRGDRVVLERAPLGLDQRRKLGARQHCNQRSDAAALVVAQRRIGSAVDQHAHRVDVGGPRGANQRDVGDLGRRRHEARVAIEQRLRHAAHEIGALRDHQGEQVQGELGTRRSLVLADVVDAITRLDHAQEPAVVCRCAALDQHLGRIEAQVVERDHDRRETLRRLRVEIGLARDQRAQRGVGAAAGREHHRRKTGDRNFDVVPNARLALGQIVDRSSGVDVRARRDQCGRDLAAIVRGRVHERRLPLPLLDDVDVRAVLDEQADGVDAARARREHERCFALGQRQVDARAGVEQCSQQIGVGAKRSFVHRPDAVPVREIRVAFCTEQRLHAAHARRNGRRTASASSRRRPSRWRRRLPRASSRTSAASALLRCFEQLRVELRCARSAKRDDQRRCESTDFGQRCHVFPHDGI